MVRAVDLGYRVIDEYIRQGQQAAQRFADRAYGAETLRSDVADLSARVGHYASEWMELWMDWMGAMRTAQAQEGDPRRPTAHSEAAGDAQPGPERRPLARARLAIRLTSARPAEAWADLRCEASGSSFRVHELRAATPDLPRIRDVRVVRAEDDTVTVHISVPDDQPPGSYSAPVVDADSGVAVGAVRVRIA
jgi:hypothetical protein